MSAEALGDVPGGERVLAKSQRVTGADTSSIASTRNSLQTAADQAGHSHQTITGTLTGMSSAWKGSDADAFHGYLSTFADASKAAKQHLDEGIAGLDRAIKELDNAKQRITKALHAIRDDYQSSLRTAEARANAERKPVTDADKKALADKAIDTHEREIDNAVQDAEEALGTIANDLNVSVSGLDTQFSGIPHPNTGTGTSPSAANVNYSGSGGENYSGGSGGGGGGGGGMGSSGGPPAGPVPGNVRQWIEEAIKELREAGVNVSEADIDKIWQVIEHESGGDPKAINDWDSNAAAGTPSKGLMQCIDPTFDSYKIPGHDDIWNPVDNIAAGVNYTIERYGSLDQHPGLASLASGGGYKPY